MHWLPAERAKMTYEIFGSVWFSQHGDFVQMPLKCEFAIVLKFKNKESGWREKVTNIPINGLASISMKKSIELGKGFTSDKWGQTIERVQAKFTSI